MLSARFSRLARALKSSHHEERDPLSMGRRRQRKTRTSQLMDHQGKFPLKMAVLDFLVDEALLAMREEGHVGSDSGEQGVGEVLVDRLLVDPYLYSVFWDVVASEFLPAGSTQDSNRGSSTGLRKLGESVLLGSGERKHQVFHKPCLVCHEDPWVEYLDLILPAEDEFLPQRLERKEPKGNDRGL